MPPHGAATHVCARTAGKSRFPKSRSGASSLRISHPVNTAIRSSSGKTMRRCPPKPRAIQIYPGRSVRGSSHHLNPYLKPSSASVNGVSDCLTQSCATICFPSHMPSWRYRYPIFARSVLFRNRSALGIDYSHGRSLPVMLDAKRREQIFLTIPFDILPSLFLKNISQQLRHETVLLTDCMLCRSV